MCDLVRLCVAQGSEYSGDGYTDYQESVVNGSQKVSASQRSYTSVKADVRMWSACFVCALAVGFFVDRPGEAPTADQRARPASLSLIHI